MELAWRRIPAAPVKLETPVNLWLQQKLAEQCGTSSP
jgi:hypothetical protein